MTPGWSFAAYSLNGILRMGVGRIFYFLYPLDLREPFMLKI